MINEYIDVLGSERTVELEFITEKLKEFNNIKILDVGGIPTHQKQYDTVLKISKDNNLDYKICDFRGGYYQGDFVTIPIFETFDAIIFLSSLEHFPQCTEGDRLFRENEDIKGFERATNLLNKGGKILLTVPFGKEEWQPLLITPTRMSGAQQIYSMNRINIINKKLNIIEKKYIHITR